MSTPTVRFDIESHRFLRVSCEYRTAVAAADSLRRRLQTADKPPSAARAGHLEAELAAAEARIDAAREALAAHTRRTAIKALNDRNVITRMSRSPLVA